MAELGKKVMEDASKNIKKRKLSTTGKSPGPTKHLKLEKKEKEGSQKTQSKLNLKPSTPRKTQSSSPKKNASPKKGSATFKGSNIPIKRSPTKRTPSKNSKQNGEDSNDSSQDETDSSSDDDDMPLADLKKSPSKSAKSSEMTLADLKKKLVKDLPQKEKANQEQKRRGRPRKTDKGPEKPKRPRGRPRKEECATEGSGKSPVKVASSLESTRKRKISAGKKVSAL